jgi:methylated-DNA-[protein]-cysteine S-methyltransferase
MPFYHAVFESPVGKLGLLADDEALVSLSFEERSRADAGTAVTDEANPIVRQAVRELQLYFAGTLRQFSIPLKPAGTAFQSSVWRGLTQIPYGRTCSYGELARVIGRPRAVRAVGGACGRNPIGILIPCHRVVGADGGLTGFGGGVATKAMLLALEQRYSE